MSEKAQQNAPERCSCCTCGYTWVKGQHGGHSCAQVMEVTVADLRARLAKYEDAEGNPISTIAEQARELPPFAQKVISKLKRFEECASDSDAGGVDIGRHWLDLLTQLGLLNRVQRSPGLWEISQQGEDLLAAAPSAGSQGGDV